MNTRNEQWMDEFSHLLPDDERTRNLVLGGDAEICPCCGEVSAYAWTNCTGYDQFPDGIIPGGFSPGPGLIAHIGTVGWDEWECGHCKTRLMNADSPLNYWNQD